MSGRDQDSDAAPAAAMVGEQVLRALRRLTQRVAMYTKDRARDAGLSAPQVLCLRAVSELSPEHCTVAHVAQHAALSLPTASRLLTQLVDAGDLKREYAPRDRRKVFLALTEQGQEKLHGPLRRLQESFERRLQQFDETEREQLLASVQLLEELMDEAEPDCSTLGVED